MNGFSILMIIFGVGVFLAGLYLYTGHRSELLLWRTHNVKTMPIEEIKKAGFWTMISSLIIFALAILGFFIEV